MQNSTSRIDSTERYGEDQEFASAKRDMLYDWCMESGQGFMAMDWDPPPESCSRFILSQFERFNAPFPEELFPILKISSQAVLHWIDFLDPYLLYWDTTDICLTSDWEFTTFIIDGSEIDPCEVETFTLNPGTSESTFHHCMSHPGLESLPNGMGEEIKELMLGGYNNEEIWGAMDAETDNALREVCTFNGVTDNDMMENYFNLAAWATFCWLMTPEGMALMAEHNCVMEAVYAYGECIIHEGYVYGPDQYQKIERPPKTCGQCGVNSWCVEEILEDRGLSFMCESCINEGMPPLGPFMCATKFCKWTKCPHHPNFAESQSHMGGFHRKYGQLNGMAQGTVREKLGLPSHLEVPALN